MDRVQFAALQCRFVGRHRHTDEPIEYHQRLVAATGRRQCNRNAIFLPRLTKVFLSIHISLYNLRLQFTDQLSSYSTLVGLFKTSLNAIFDFLMVCRIENA